MPRVTSAKKGLVPKGLISNTLFLVAPRNACTILNPLCEFAKDKVVLSASFGVYLSPSPFLDQVKPIESDRIINLTQRGGVFPSNVNALASNFLIIALTGSFSRSRSRRITPM